MDTYITSDAIQALHERRSLTQRALAERPGVTDKAVSKWETAGAARRLPCGAARARAEGADE